MLTADFSLGNVARMTEKEQNMAIEEALGVRGPWKEEITPCGCDGQSRLRNPDGKWLRHFTEDLNAMHEAEKTLTEKQRVWYLQKLTQVRYKEGNGGMIACMIDKTTFATASQRAEAFLRVKQLWKD